MKNYEERGKVYRAAIEKWGIDAQEWMVVEEMGELQRALGKLRRRKISMAEVVDEIADVQIMLEQLQIMLGCEEPVRRRIDKKVLRLEKMIREDTP